MGLRSRHLFWYLCKGSRRLNRPSPKIMNPYKARGIVLHTIKYGDTSLVAYILTDTIGRQNYMVQGVRSKRGKGNKASMLQPMFLLEFEGVPSQHSQMDRMKDVSLLRPLQNIPFDVRKSTISLFMAEVLYKLVKEVEPNSPLFGFVRDSVIALDAIEEGVANFHLWFLVQMSAFLGFYPANQYSEGDYFDIVEGSFTATIPEHSIILSRSNAALLASLLTLSPEELGSLPLSRGQRGEFLSALLDYFGYHLDTIHKIQSLKILAEVF